MRAEIAKTIARTILKLTRRWWLPKVKRHVMHVLDRAHASGIITSSQRSDLVGIAYRHRGDI